jgi:hypothetical protein
MRYGRRKNEQPMSEAMQKRNAALQNNWFTYAASAQRLAF